MSTVGQFKQQQSIVQKLMLLWEWIRSDSRLWQGNKQSGCCGSGDKWESKL